MRLCLVVGLINFFLWTSKAHGQGFTENKGQWPTSVLYSGTTQGGRIFIQSHAVRYHLFETISALHGHHERDSKRHGHVIDFQLIQASTKNTIGVEKIKKYENFFLGNDPNSWAPFCRMYQSVVSREVYPHLDWIWHSDASGIKHDFVVHPGGNPEMIKWQYNGASEVSIRNNRLIVRHSFGELQEEEPYAYQIVDGKKRTIACRYSMDHGICRFVIGEYRRDLDLIIDPQLIFASYSGSFADNFGYTATYDSQGYLYSGSSAFGLGYPTTVGAYQTTFAGGDGSFGLPGTDIALSKYATDGTSMVWSTYLGGAHDELPHSLICNSDDELLMYGSTSSSNYPTTAGAFDQTFNGGTAFAPNGVGTNYIFGSDIIISRINSNGSALIASTFVGGALNDGVNTAAALKFNYADEFRGEIDLDQNGNIIIASTTFSEDFPVVNAFQNSLGGAQDAVIFKMTPNLSNMIWSSFVGGSGNDSGYSVAEMSGGDLVVTGGTTSTNFPVSSGALFPNFQGGTADGWIYRVSENGGTVVSSTYFGSNAYDQMYFVDVDDANDVYVYGQSLAGGNYWIVNASWSQTNSGMVVSKLASGLGSIIWSTTFGTGSGKPNLSPSAFLVDVCNNIYLSGWGGAVNLFSTPNADYTTGMFVTPNAFQTTTDGSDFYLLVLPDNGSTPVYASFFGGNISDEHVDGGTSRFDRRGVIYQSVCAGCQANSDFPCAPSNVVSTTNNSTGCNNAVFKFDFQLPLTTADFQATPEACLGQSVVFNSSSTNANILQWSFGDNTTANGPTVTHVYTEAGEYTITLIASSNATCNGYDTLTRTILVSAPQTSTLTPIETCKNDQVTLGPQNPELSFQYQWTPTDQLSDPTDPNPLLTAFDSTLYTLLVQRGMCVDTMFQSVHVNNPDLIVPSDTTICNPGIATFSALGLPSGGSYFWSTDSTFSDIINASPNDHSIELIVSSIDTIYVAYENNSCRTERRIIAGVVDSQTAISSDQIVCAGDSASLNVVNPGEEISYYWSPENLIVQGQNTPEVVALVPQSGYYFVHALSPNGCEAKDSVYVQVSQLNPASITASATPGAILIGGSSQLLALPSGYNYHWTPSLYLNNADIPNPIARPESSINYLVEITDGNCFGSALVKIEVYNSLCQPPLIYVPNAFTPNADGKNELLYVRGVGITKLYFTIYDRWGEKIFETESIDKGWDGTYKGKLCDPAVYVYYLYAECAGGEEYTEKGNISLLR
jgi:gliding motility-associated-like protein